MDRAQAGADGNAVTREGHKTTPPKQEKLGWGTPGPQYEVTLCGSENVAQFSVVTTTGNVLPLSPLGSVAVLNAVLGQSMQTLHESYLPASSIQSLWSPAVNWKSWTRTFSVSAT